jgi:hypothetical protein
MTLHPFHNSLDQPAPPAAIDPCLAALWWAARRDWHKAHAIAQDIKTAHGAWVHAYLHRVEGDAFNAAFWYRRARKPVLTPDPSTEQQEWQAIVAALLPRPADPAV